MAGENGELRGVGGWLRFFVIVIGVISPLQMVVMTAINLYRDPQVAAAYGDLWPMLQAAEWSIVAAAILGCWFMVWRLVRRRVRKTVWITIAGIWLLVLGTQLADLLAVSLIAAIPFGELAAAMAGGMAKSIGFGVVWTSYFLVSKRVANTYVRNPADEEMAEVFG
jgi:hypothetical protein